MAFKDVTAVQQWSLFSAGMCTIEGNTGTLQRPPVLLCALRRLVFPICAKRFHNVESNRHYSTGTIEASPLHYCRWPEKRRQLDVAVNDASGERAGERRADGNFGAHAHLS